MVDSQAEKPETLYLCLKFTNKDKDKDIALNYKQVKVQWTEQLVATQQQKTERIKKETQKIKVFTTNKSEKHFCDFRLSQMLRDRKQFWKSKSKKIF